MSLECFDSFPRLVEQVIVVYAAASAYKVTLRIYISICHG